MSSNDESRTLQLHISDDAVWALRHFCTPEVDICFEAAPPTLAASWIARWARAPMTPGMSFLDDLQLHPLTVALGGEPLGQVMHYARRMGHPPEIIAAAVVSARGAQIAWFHRTGTLGKGIPEPPPPHTGA